MGEGPGAPSSSAPNESQKPEEGKDPASKAGGTREGASAGQLSVSDFHNLLAQTQELTAALSRSSAPLRYLAHSKYPLPDISSLGRGLIDYQIVLAADSLEADVMARTEALASRLLNLKVTLPVPEDVEHFGLDLDLAVNEWAKMLPFFIRNSIKGKEAAIQRAVLAYQPQPQLRPVDLELLEMQKNAAESILAGTRWMTAAEVAEESGRSRSNPHALANRWKKEGRVFAIKYQGVERYPRYAFDEHMEPVPVIAEVIRHFVADADGAELDPWDIAAWFESANTYLDSARPRECMDRPDIITFALENMNNWTHG